MTPSKISCKIYKIRIRPTSGVLIPGLISPPTIIKHLFNNKRDAPALAVNSLSSRKIHFLVNVLYINISLLNLYQATGCLV